MGPPQKLREKSPTKIPAGLHDWASQLLGDHPSPRSQQDVGAPTRSLHPKPNQKKKLGKKQCPSKGELLK